MVAVIDRKGNSMKTFLALVAFSLAAVAQPVIATPPQESAKFDRATDTYEGWRLAVQAWTFKQFTFSESVAKAASLGLHWIEAYPGQQVRPGAETWM